MSQTKILCEPHIAVWLRPSTWLNHGFVVNRLLESPAGTPEMYVCNVCWQSAEQPSPEMCLSTLELLILGLH